jgi:cytochrome b561
MGMFIVVLRDDAPDRSSFVEAHQSLGLAVFLFVLFRLSWLLVNPPPPPASGLRPWEHRLAVLVHFALYGFILAFPLTGFFMTAYKGEAINFFGLTLPAFVTATAQPAQRWAELHNIVLPFTFYAIIFAHIAAVVKHQFLDRRSSHVRRMLT